MIGCVHWNDCQSCCTTELTVRNLSMECGSSSHKKVELLCPTQAVFFQHTRRAAHQAGHFWEQTMIATSELPSPSEWGWIRNDNDG